MQCYQGEALRLQVYSEAHVLLPEVYFDPLMIDQLMDEFEIETHEDYMELETTRRMELARRLSLLCREQRIHRKRRVT